MPQGNHKRVDPAAAILREEERIRRKSISSSARARTVISAAQEETANCQIVVTTFRGAQAAIATAAEEILAIQHEIEEKERQLEEARLAQEAEDAAREEQIREIQRQILQRREDLINAHRRKLSHDQALHRQGW